MMLVLHAGELKLIVLVATLEIIKSEELVILVPIIASVVKIVLPVEFVRKVILW